MWLKIIFWGFKRIRGKSKFPQIFRIRNFLKVAFFDCIWNNKIIFLVKKCLHGKTKILRWNLTTQMKWMTNESLKLFMFSIKNFNLFLYFWVKKMNKKPAKNVTLKYEMRYELKVQSDSNIRKLLFDFFVSLFVLFVLISAQSDAHSIVDVFIVQPGVSE